MQVNSRASLLGQGLKLALLAELSKKTFSQLEAAKRLKLQRFEAQHSE